MIHYRKILELHDEGISLRGISASVYEIERACKMVISITKRPTVKSIQTILKNNKKSDAEKELKRKTEINGNDYGFTRGAAYYGGKENDE